ADERLQGLRLQGVEELAQRPLLLQLFVVALLDRGILLAVAGAVGLTFSLKRGFLLWGPDPRVAAAVVHGADVAVGGDAEDAVLGLQLLQAPDGDTHGLGQALLAFSTAKAVHMAEPTEVFTGQCPALDPTSGDPAGRCLSW